MRTAKEQFEVNEKILIDQIKHLKTSINYFEAMFKKDKFDYITVVHVQDDALGVYTTIEKYLLLQLMKDTEMGPWPDPNIEYTKHLEVSIPTAEEVDSKSIQ